MGDSKTSLGARLQSLDDSPQGGRMEIEAFGIRNGEMWFSRDAGTNMNGGIYTATRRP